MKQLSIVLSIAILLGFLLYAINIVSQNNTCTWVRSFICDKQNAEVLASQKETIKAEIQEEQDTLLAEKISASLDEGSDEYMTLKKMGNSFIHLCNPLIIEQSGAYLLDYTACNLQVIANSNRKYIQEVQVNGESLSRESIQEELWKLYFTF